MIEIGNLAYMLRQATGEYRNPVHTDVWSYALRVLALHTGKICTSFEVFALTELPERCTLDALAVRADKLCSDGHWFGPLLSAWCQCRATGAEPTPSMLVEYELLRHLLPIASGETLDHAAARVGVRRRTLEFNTSGVKYETDAELRTRAERALKETRR